jgi:hypothetical protein
VLELDYTRDKTFAYYQTQEIYGEEGSLVHLPCPANERLPCVAFYYDARDAFSMGDEENVHILRDVLKELLFRTRLENALLEMQWRQQFVWGDTGIQLSPEFRRLLQASKPGVA